MSDKIKLLDLFSGIGGFSLGLERTGGFETAAFCEIEPYPCRVLAKHWPEVPIYNDVRTLTADRLAADGIEVTAICGGFPCQDLSTAGAQAGIDGERSGLWSECARLIGEIQPDFALFENVTNLLNGGGGDWFKRVLWDISTLGYDAEWHCIPAGIIGAPHRRDRVWIACYPNKGSKPTLPVDDETPIMPPNGSYPNKTQLERGRVYLGIRTQLAKISYVRWEEDKPGVVRTLDGVPSQMDRLGCLGNAVVPQIPEIIGRAWLEANR